MKEARIQEVVVGWWRALGHVAIKLTTNGAMGVKGWPDYIFISGAAIFFIEFKSTDGGCTPLQLEKHKILRRKGQRVYVCCDAAAGKAICARELKGRGT